MNLSQRQLVEPDLAEAVARILCDSGLDPAALHLEITESAMMERAEKALETIDALKTLGVRIHLDDFGTGYSSLSHLQRFPIDALKIDRSFIAALESGADGEPIVAAIVNMARNLHVDVIAEGIETYEQAQKLRRLDCLLAQGYFYARPVAAESVDAMLDESLPLAALAAV